MNFKKQVGDRLVLKFLHDQAGGGVIATDKVNGKVCRTAPKLSEAYPGETWEVVLLGENPKGTINFVEPVRLIDSEDGIHHLLCRHDLRFHAGLRWTEYFLKKAVQKYGAGSLTYLDKLIDIINPDTMAKGHPLPDDYLRDLLLRALLLTESHHGEKSAQVLPLLDRLGDIEQKMGNLEAAKQHFKRFVSVLSTNFLSSGKPALKVFHGAKLKLARIYFSQSQFKNAVWSYQNSGPEGSLSIEDRRQFAAAYAGVGNHNSAASILMCLTRDLAAALLDVKSPIVCAVVKI